MKCLKRASWMSAREDGWLLLSLSITLQLWKICVMQRPRFDIKLTFLLGSFIRKVVITRRNTVLEKPPGCDWRKTTSQNFPKWLMTEVSHLGCFSIGNCSEWPHLWLQPGGHQISFCLVTHSARGFVLCVLRFLCFFNQVVSPIPSGRGVPASLPASYTPPSLSVPISFKRQVLPCFLMTMLV